MSQEEIELRRVQMLRGAHVDLEYLRQYYGLDDLRGNSALGQALQDFSSQDAVRDNGAVDRYRLELFFQRNGLLPKSWMAVRLGLSPVLLESLLKSAATGGLRLPPRLYVLYDELVEGRLADDLVANLPGLRFRTFSDHESFCSRLHDELRQILKWPAVDSENGPEWCATDKELERIGDGDYPRRYSQYLDCITCLPVSVAHSMWLDFRKPMSLAPDRCSKLTYLRYHAVLAEFKAGTREPEDLERYQRLLETPAR